MKHLKHYWWIIFYILLAAGTPWILNLAFMRFTVDSAEDLGNPQWLGFWGSFLGSALACIPALIAITQNNRFARQQHMEFLTSQRLSVRPIFDLKIYHDLYPKSSKEVFDGIYAMDKQGALYHPDYYDFIFLSQSQSANKMKFINCGSGPALQATLSMNQSSVNLPHLAKESNSAFQFFPDMEFFKGKISKGSGVFSLELTFCDIYGNRYTQPFKVKCYPCSDEGIDYLSFDVISVSQPELLPL